MDIEGFLRRWTSGEGGAERANYGMFLSELCDVLGVGRPDPASGGARLGGYQFEAPVRSRESEGVKSTKRIDLYKRGHFILEAKQSQQKARNPDQGVLPFEPGVQGRRSVSKAWDAMMMRARAQAEGYVFRLPPDHAAPLFLITCDVGHSFEIFADFTGTGRNYTQFPDRKGFRIFLEDLRHDDIRVRLKAIWEAPQSLDPATERARVTNAIAKRLAEVSKALEKQGHPASEVAPFLMRCVFTMFAEDVGLLPADSFKGLLQRCAADPSIFVPMIEELWAKMDTGGFYSGLGEHLRRFNGGLFKHARAFALGREEIGELISAAHADWRQVEPAIFGTLLEQALEVKERARLGAHFTPRAYVDRLVNVTVMEPLREEWREKRTAIEDVKAQGDVKAAVALAKAFHHRLCEVKVLDPACGTGNFLYAALELIKRLEAEVLELLLDLGETETMSFETVDPHQFLGIELNPRAAAIAELVVWIGYLQWHYRTHDGHPNDPVLRDFRNIECKDAVLTWDGYPETSAGYANARLPDWPEADFIVGNPPFVSNRRLREMNGDGYVEALRQPYPEFDQAADFVLFFWIGSLRKRLKLPLRVGFVSTSRLRMIQNRQVLKNALTNRWHIIYAIPDHEWPQEADAAVRVCFAVVSQEKVRAEIVYAPDHDQISGRVTGKGYLSEYVSEIFPDLSRDGLSEELKPLRANSGLGHAGVKPYSRELHIDGSTREYIFDSLEDREKLAPRIFNGHDVGQSWRGLYVLDLNALSENEIEQSHKKLFQYLLESVKPKRARERNPRLVKNYWKFEANRDDLRDGLSQLDRYIVTLENSPQRYFTFLEKDILPDQKLRVVASQSAYILGVLSTRFHNAFAVRTGGRAGKANTPVYNTPCFTQFPFPEADLAQRQVIGDIAEALDAHRKRVLADHPHLTLTGLYNVLERLKAGVAPDALTPEERRIFDDGLVLILREYHERLDRAVLAAYGWAEDIRDEDVLARLVALNRERAAEEAAGQVRWLRPDYQIPRFARAAGVQSGELELETVSAEILRPDFPKSRDAQPFAVLKAVERAGVLSEDEVVRAFANGPRHRQRILTLLRTLDDYGHLDRLEDGRVLTHRAA